MSLVSPMRRWGEVLAVGLLLGVFGAVTVLSLQSERRLARQKALVFELQLLRSAINLYKVVNKTEPATLMALAIEVYQMPGDETTHTFIQGAPIDRNGSVHDPFGHVYQYDPATGWIRSTTSGYEFW